MGVRVDGGSASVWRGELIEAAVAKLVVVVVSGWVRLLGLVVMGSESAWFI